MRRCGVYLQGAQGSHGLVKTLSYEDDFEACLDGSHDIRCFSLHVGSGNEAWHEEGGDACAVCRGKGQTRERLYE